MEKQRVLVVDDDGRYQRHCSQSSERGLCRYLNLRWITGSRIISTQKVHLIILDVMMLGWRLSLLRRFVLRKTSLHHSVGKVGGYGTKSWGFRWEAEIICHQAVQHHGAHGRVNRTATLHDPGMSMCRTRRNI